MKIRKIPRRELDLFTTVLPAFGEVHVPMARKGGHVFGQPRSWADVALHYPRTLLPPKKYFLPPREVTFTFDERDGYRDCLSLAARPTVLFGLHSYDIDGLNILQRVFGQGRYLDPYFMTRRRATVVIGVDFEPDELHFARSMGADFVDQGFDLFLSDLGEEYLVLVGTSRGDDLVSRSGCLLQDPTPADFEEYKRRSNLRRGSYRTRVDLGDLPEILEMEYRSQVWEELGRRCLSCGACSMVCPTCYCFDVEDEVDLGSRAGRRVRSWDSCLFRTHALVAGGENFRAARASRINFRYYHKQRGFVAEYGRPSCVGCGRCIATCPARIDIIAVIDQIRGELHGSARQDSAQDQAQ